jgi:hypothetical protein
MVTDEGNNVIHLLAEKSSLDRNMEDDLLITFRKISALIGKEELVTLLKQENLHGYTPLQWCCCQNAYGLFQLILNTPGLYLIKEEHEGGMVSRHYDVTDFEICHDQNAMKHALYGICFVHKENMESANTKKLLYSKFIQIYCNKKLRINAIFLAACIIAQLLYIICQGMYLQCGRHILFEHFSNYQNRSSEAFCFPWIFPTEVIKYLLKLPLIIIILIMVILSIAIECFTGLLWVYALLSSSSYRDLFKQNYILQYHSHQLFFISNNLCFALLIISDLTEASTGKALLSENLRVFLFMSVAFIGVYFISHFLILTKVCGVLLITMNRLMLDLVPFAVFYFFLLPGTAMTLRYLAFIYPNVTNDFDTFLSTMYSSFMMHLGKKDLEPFNPYKNSPIALQQSLVAMASMVIINFMIAVFSNSVSEVMQNIDLHTLIHKLSLIHKAERLFCNIPGVRKLHMLLVRRNFQMTGDRICLCIDTPS